MWTYCQGGLSEYRSLQSVCNMQRVSQEYFIGHPGGPIEIASDIRFAKVRKLMTFRALRLKNDYFRPWRKSICIEARSMSLCVFVLIVILDRDHDLSVCIEDFKKHGGRAIAALNRPRQIQRALGGVSTH